MKKWSTWHDSDKLMLAVIIALAAVVFSTIIHAGVKKHRLDIEQGELHCGDVEVVTPTGQKAYEHKCWRSKQ